MYLAADLFREDGKICIDWNGRPYDATLAGIPEAFWQLETVQAQQGVRAYLEELLCFLKDQYWDAVKAAILIIPWHFTYPQKKALKTIAAQAGIDRVRLGYATELAAYDYMQRLHESSETNLFICLCQGRRVELSACIVGDGVAESFGVTGTCRGKDEPEESFLRKTLGELRQFQKELPRNDCPDYRILLLGEVPDALSREIKARLPQCAGTEPCLSASPVWAAILHIRSVWGPQDNGLLMSQQPRNLWAALGDLGEQRMVVPRYTSFPLRKSADLLVSTQTLLHIYEGNFQNPRFDTLLASFPLPQAEEGREITCFIDMNADGSLGLEVKTHRGDLLLREKL